MKVTDYAPRAAPFDSYLTGSNLIGVEVGVDVGAHAHALLAYCPIATLHLVDPWPNPYCRGYCEGRLSAMPGLRSRFYMHKCGSLEAAANIARGEMFDAIYIDQEHDAEAVSGDLRSWWQRLKLGGVLGYRNYTGRGTPLDKAIDEFVAKAGKAIERAQVEIGEIVIVKAR